MDYFTSDLHFGHNKAIAHSDRPFRDLEEMHSELIKRWNSEVQDEDRIYVLGDLFFMKFSEAVPISNQLKGNKILIQGNHDKYSLSQYRRLGFEVLQEAVINIAGQRCRLSHYPYAPKWYRKPFCHKSELRFLEKRPKRDKTEILLHGHTHMKYKQRDNMIHIGVDAWDYMPVSYSEIESILNKRNKC